MHAFPVLKYFLPPPPRKKDEAGNSRNALLCFATFREHSPPLAPISIFRVVSWSLPPPRAINSNFRQHWWNFKAPQKIRRNFPPAKGSFRNIPKGCPGGGTVLKTDIPYAKGLFPFTEQRFPIRPLSPPRKGPRNSFVPPPTLSSALSAGGINLKAACVGNRRRRWRRE